MCDIQNIQLTSQDFSNEGILNRLTVDARVDCIAVNIEIRRNAGDAPILSATNVASTEAFAAAGLPPLAVTNTFQLPGGLSIRCDGGLHVTIICADDANCRFSGQVDVHCKGFKICPDTLILIPSFDQSQDCLAAGEYEITARVEPNDPDVRFSWSQGTSGSTIFFGSGPTQTITVQDGDPESTVIVTATKGDCPPLAGFVDVPPGGAPLSAVGYTVFVVQGANEVAGPHRISDGITWVVEPAVSPGTYIVRITQPQSGPGVSFEWRNSDWSFAAPTDPQRMNEREVTVNAGESITSNFMVTPCNCCTSLPGSVTLTGQSTRPPNGKPPTGEEPTEEPVNGEPEWPNLCGFLELIAALALIVALLSLVSSGCLMLLPAAIPTLIGAIAVAVIAAILVFLICRPSACRILAIVVWAFMWAIVLGIVIAIGCGSLVSAFIVVLFGGITAALIWLMISMRCRVPRLLGLP